MNLEIGGGTNRRAGYRNMDINPVHADDGLVGRVQDGIPLPDDSIDAAYASHVLEHIPQGVERINALNEIWRVLRVDGLFEIVVPCIGYTDHEGDKLPHYAGWQGWADPTHVSYWWYPESFWYLDGTFAANADYGLKPWRTVSQSLIHGWEAHWTLAKTQEKT